ncbi:hypothetical protein FGB62_264g02 [Gracilaria domingensis]|nr:hypothetical protein FGB62_264g02 [Gracilaria domingensis]
MNPSNDEEEIFPFETLRDPFEELDDVSALGNEPGKWTIWTEGADVEDKCTKALCSTEKIGQILAEYGPDSGVVLDAAPKRKRKRHEYEPTPMGASVYMNLGLENEKWAQLGTFFEDEDEEESPMMYSHQNALPLGLISDQTTLQGINTLEEEGMISQNASDPMESSVAQYECFVRSPAFETDDGDNMDMKDQEKNRQATLSEFPVVDAEAILKEKVKRTLAPDSKVVKTDPRIRNNKKIKIENPRVQNPMVGTAAVECMECGRHFGSELALRRHALRVHKADGEYECRFCPLKLKSEVNRKKHELTQHDLSGGVRLDCDVEGGCFTAFNLNGRRRELRIRAEIFTSAGSANIQPNAGATWIGTCLPNTGLGSKRRAGTDSRAHNAGGASCTKLITDCTSATDRLTKGGRSKGLKEGDQAPIAEGRVWSRGRYVRGRTGGHLIDCAEVCKLDIIKYSRFL